MNDSENKLLATYKPRFIWWIAVFGQSASTFFISIWVVIVFSGIISGKASPAIAGMPFLIMIIGISLVSYFGKKYNYAKTEYKIYQDRLEFEEGFLTINKKVIKLKDVKEVSLRRGVLQRQRNLGTIYLATLATGSSDSNRSFAFGFGNVASSGVGIRDIENPEQAYEQIKALVDARQ